MLWNLELYCLDLLGDAWEIVGVTSMSSLRTSSSLY